MSDSTPDDLGHFGEDGTARCVRTSDDITSVRVVYTVEYAIATGRVDPPDSEEEELLFLHAFLEAAPDRDLNIAWDDEDETVFEPTGWGVQTEFWGDLWTGLKPPEESTSVAEHVAATRAVVAAAAALVGLKDGPKDSVYRRRKEPAWATLRAALVMLDAVELPDSGRTRPDPANPG